MPRFRSSYVGDRRIAQQQMVAATQVRAASEAAAVTDRIIEGIGTAVIDEGTGLGLALKQIREDIYNLQNPPEP